MGKLATLIHPGSTQQLGEGRKKKKTKLWDTSQRRVKGRMHVPILCPHIYVPILLTDTALLFHSVKFALRDCHTPSISHGCASLIRTSTSDHDITPAPSKFTVGINVKSLKRTQQLNENFSKMLKLFFFTISKVNLGMAYSLYHGV